VIVGVEIIDNEESGIRCGLVICTLYFILDNAYFRKIYMTQCCPSVIFYVVGTIMAGAKD
jgi:hypothetical protein